LTTGVFLTVSTVTGTRERALELRRRHKALCENMEGAAVAQVCALYGIPLLEIRGISNMVEDRDALGWEKGLAALNCQRAVLELIRSGCLP
jgi:futalosine hydrolase